MGNTKPGKRFARRTVYVATGFALLAVIAGFGMAAFTVTSGPALNGGGEYHATNAIAWWAETDVGVSVQPTALPATASNVVGTPTVLAAAAANYGINVAVANDVSQFWKFTEAAGATANTELELSFSVNTAAGITTITSYVETQAAPPAGGATFSFYFDLGSAATATITLNSVTEIAQQCGAVGTCP
jgi:hypothetical protein